MRAVWGSPNAVMALAVAVALTVLTACGGVIYYASTAVNRITEARETQLLERAVARRLNQLRDDVASVAIWTDAYELTARTYDKAWAHTNYGVYFHQYLHHDVSVVLDARDQPLYLSQDGEIVSGEHLAAFLAATRPLLVATRSAAAAKIAVSPKALGFARVGAVQSAVRVGSRVYLASASTVVPEPDYAKPLLTRPEPVVISAVEINDAYLKALKSDFGLSGARLAPLTQAPKPVVTLKGPDGRAVGQIVWSPERPGLGVYRDAKWPILALALLVGLTVALLILRLRRLAQEVTQARDRAEAGERAKSEFIANMSHEIRTPMNGVLGMAQAMEAHDLSADQRGRLKVIRESGVTLMSVLNDVLDLSKIEAGQLEIHESTFMLADLAGQVSASFIEPAAAKDVAFSLHIAPDCAPAWTGDVLRIRQVLSNLLSNAVKFTSAGSVGLIIAPVEQGLEFRIADTGIGLTEEELPRLFRRFAQADASTTRRFGGTGLGLSICRELVDRMGGTITVASRAGEGSTFTVTLPLKPAEALAPACEPVPSVAPNALRILAAEDNATNQLVLRALIEPLGADLTLVANGREAVEAFLAGRFDVVLMDVQMPVMDGLDATRAIRAHEGGGSRTPILALTANVMNHQVDSYREAGMDGHVAKPLGASELYAAIEAALSGDSPMAADDPETLPAEAQRA